MTKLERAVARYCCGVSCFALLLFVYFLQPLNYTLFTLREYINQRKTPKCVYRGTKDSNRVDFQALEKIIIDQKLFFLTELSSTFFDYGFNQFEKNTKSAKSGLKTRNRGFQVL